MAASVTENLFPIACLEHLEPVWHAINALTVNIDVQLTHAKHSTLAHT